MLYLAMMIFTLVMEEHVIFVVAGIIANMAKMHRLTVPGVSRHYIRQLHTHTHTQRGYMTMIQKLKRRRLAGLPPLCVLHS